MLAPLTDLVADHRETKETKCTGTKKNQWSWHESHQKAFDNVKNTVRCDVLLVYPDYSQPFIKCTDVSTRQIGAVFV